MEMHALNISKLEIGYPQKGGGYSHVAGPIDLTAQSGELVCLLGPNGVGKSTLLRTLAGIQQAHDGEMSILNQDVAKISKRKLAKLLSVVLTDRITSGNLTAYDLVTLGRIPHTGWFGNLSDEDKHKTEWAISSTHIEAFQHKNIHTLSDGERQKVMIARALAQDTPVILLDEPTAHLDVPNRIDIVRLLRKLAQETGKAIIMSTHELDLALQAADKIWLMTEDNRTFSGTPEDLVLNDALGNTFTKEGIEFDKAHGTFKVVPSTKTEISLDGDEIGIFWTKRALERQGYIVKLDQRGEAKVHVSRDNSGLMWRFEYERGISEHQNIDSLLRRLNEKGGTI